MKTGSGQKRKRRLSILLALAMIITSIHYGGIIPTHAQETAQQANDVREDKEEVKRQMAATRTVKAAPEGMPDNEELFAGYMERMLYPERAFSFFGNFGEGQLSGANLKIYRELKEKIKQTAEKGGSTAYVITEDLGIRWASSATTNDEILGEAGREFDKAVDLNAIISCLMVDNPYELYWYDKTQGTGCSYMIYSQGAEMWIADMKFTMAVVPGYQENGDVNTVNADRAIATKTAVDKAREIVAANVEKSDYGKLVAYADAIRALVDYNYDVVDQDYSGDKYGDPWQLIYVFDGDEDTKVVCEGYAKAFQYLCDLTDFSGDITCYTVTGTLSYTGLGVGAGGHMWNVITVRGKNYLVDVTNAELGAPSKDNNLFLAGASEGSADTCYEIESDGYRYRYTYDVSDQALYGAEILTLAGERYVPGKENAIAVMVDASREYDGSACTISNVKGTHLTWRGDSALTIDGYYVDRGITKTTEDNSGASAEGAAPVNPGLYYAKVTVPADDIYESATAFISFVITKRDIDSAKLSITPYTGTYDGNAHNAIVVTEAEEGYLDGKTVEYSVDEGASWSAEVPTITNAGSQKIYIKVSGTNYNDWISTAQTAQVNAKILTADMLEAPAFVYYTGNAVTPEITVWLDKASNKALTLNEDYTVSYKNHTDVQLATAVNAPTVTVTGKGNYGGQISKTFEIKYLDTLVTPKFNGNGTEEDWYAGDVVITAEGFQIADSLQGNYAASYTVNNNVTADVTLYFKQNGTGYITAGQTYTIQMDKKAPDFSSAKNGIQVEEVWYKNLLNTVSFGLFFNKNVDVTMKATDTQSGVETYYYYLDNSGTVLSAAQLDGKTFTEDKDGTFSISAEEKYVIYAYAADKVGNVSNYICSEGFVIDKTAPTVTLTAPQSTEITGESAVAKVQMNELGSVTYIVTTTENNQITPAQILADANRHNVNLLAANQNVNLSLTDLNANTIYYIYAVGTDRAGNTSAVVAKTGFTAGKPQLFANDVVVRAIGFYGDALSELEFRAEGSVKASDGTLVEGTWAFTETQIVDGKTVNSSEIYPKAYGNPRYKIVFTPNVGKEFYANTLELEIFPGIGQRSIVEEGVTIALSQNSYIYDGQSHCPTVTVTDSKVAVTENDYVISYADNIHAGTATVKIEGTGNYYGRVTRTFQIEKAEAPVIPAIAKKYIYSVGSNNHAVTVDIAALLPADRGDTTYTLAANTAAYVLDEQVSESGSLSFKVGVNGLAGDATSLTVTAVSADYEDITVKVNITLTDKYAVAQKAGSPVAIVGSNVLTYGDTIDRLTLNQAAFVMEGTDTVVPGTLSWSNPNARPDAGTTTAEWRFVPTDSNMYEELTGTLSIVVKNAAQQAPSLTFTDETIDGANDGTISGLTTDMEYRTEGTAYIRITSGMIQNGVMKNLPEGTYYIRLAKKPNYDASPEVTITIAAGEVPDTEAPTAKITVGTNYWNAFWNTVTFGTYFKETQSVEITASDSQSGVENIYYYISDTALTKAQVEAITDWIRYTESFSINPDKKCVIYAKAVDAVGNIAYISSNGLVFDATDALIHVALDDVNYVAGAAHNYTDSAAVKVTVSDALSGVKNAAYKLDDAEAVTVDLTNGNTFRVTERGSHTVVITAEDLAGNQTSKTVTFKIYKTPIVTLTPAATIVYDGAAIVAGTDFSVDWGGSQGAVTYGWRRSDALPDAAFTNGLPMEAGSYTIQVTVAKDDTNYYLAANHTANITIAKAAEPANKPDAQKPITAPKEAERLADVLLPQGWKWADSTVKVIPGGYVTAKAVYGDTENYEPCEVDLRIAGSVQIIAALSNLEYIIGKDSNAVIACTGVLEELVCVEVDGTELDPENYTLGTDAATITFAKAYLDTLAPGEHVVKLSYTAASTEAKLKIKTVEEQQNPGETDETDETDENPSDRTDGGAVKTGDLAMPWLWIALMLAALAGVVAVSERKKYN